MNYIIWIQFGKKHMFLLESVVDLRRAQGTRPLPVVQILSISYSFGGNLTKSYVSAPLPESWCPHLGEILDPPLRLISNDNKPDVDRSVLEWVVSPMLYHALSAVVTYHKTSYNTSISPGKQLLWRLIWMHWIQLFLCNGPIATKVLSTEQRSKRQIGTKTRDILQTMWLDEDFWTSAPFYFVTNNNQLHLGYQSQSMSIHDILGC